MDTTDSPADFLWHHNMLLWDYLGAPVSTSDEYCSGTLAYDWGTSNERRCPPGDYERIVWQFLSHDPGSRPAPGLNVLIVVGGVGTGKSTLLGEMLRRCANTPRVCSLATSTDLICNHTPATLFFDLSTLGTYSSTTDASDRLTEELNQLWDIVALETARIFEDSFDFDTEVRFWRWLFDQQQLLQHSRHLARWLAANDYQIKAVYANQAYGPWSVDTIREVLERERATLLQGLLPHDLAWYRIAQLVYLQQLRRDNSCHCHYMFLDNIDQLAPAVQREAVEFMILASDIIRARTIISIRPLTWKRSVHANTLIQMENHYAPSLRDVMDKRLARISHDPLIPSAISNYLRALANPMTRSHGLLSELFDVTSGQSVRAAIRNFVNFAGSRLLPSLANHDALDTMNTSTIVRAFFYGDGDAINERAFENLYTLGMDSRPAYRLVKARILHFITTHEHGVSDVNTISAILRHFGYTRDELLTAFNDLLMPSRPLLWCHDDYELRSLDQRSPVAITRLGRGYYGTLFGQLYYDEACIATSLQDIVQIERVIDFHKQLWQEDQYEIRKFVQNAGPSLYSVLYPLETPAISIVHAARLHDGIVKRHGAKPLGFDNNRVEYLSHEVQQILGGPAW